MGRLIESYCGGLGVWQWWWDYDDCSGDGKVIRFRVHLGAECTCWGLDIGNEGKRGIKYHFQDFALRDWWDGCMFSDKRLGGAPIYRGGN